MCGITGIYGIPDREAHASSAEALSRMTAQIAHRGPDANGLWVSDAEVMLGHRRLSIIDTQEQSNQPFIHEATGDVLVFNGEVYNYRELREELKGTFSFRTESDTEVVLAALQAWGAEALHRFNGMFAFAFWSREKRELLLARDRMGIKPLYFSETSHGLVFSSELRSLLASGWIDKRHDPIALSDYLRYQTVHAPRTIVQNVSMLPAGHLMRLQGEETEISAWWDMPSETAKIDGGLPRTERLKRIRNAMEKAVDLRMRSDVPLGAFLSGGIDSSLIVSMMKARSLKPVKTFTIGFEELDFNEAKHAKAVAMHLGTEHSELYVSSYDALDIIPHLPLLYDEPFADSSQIPTFLIAKMSSEYVKVALSCDGGDELFGGYNRYLWSRSIVDKTSLIPKFARQSVGSLIKKIPSKNLDYINNSFLRFLPTKYKTTLIGDKIHKVADMLSFGSELELYKGLVSQWQNPDEIVKNQSEANIFLTSEVERKSFSDIEHQMMFLDAKTYLPDDILCKVDRAAMGVSLETRVPFLNHNVVSLAWQLPLNMKIRDRQGKWILRELLCQHVPKSLIERPKQGFSLPIAEWLRGPLREWAEVLLERSRLESEGFFYPDPIRKAWQDHLNGKNMHNQLWGILMFQAWLEME